MNAVVEIEIGSHKSAKRYGLKSPYLARLIKTDHGVDRAFAPRLKDGRGRNHQRFVARGCPGDIFEARRWLWDGDRQEYVGGTVYFGVQADGSLLLLSRDEAFFSLQVRRLSGPASIEDMPDLTRPTRILPDDIRAVPLPEHG